MIKGGFVLTARQIMDSEIWNTKPSWWLKIWNYLYIKVNHEDNKIFPRGTGFFNRKMIYTDCCLWNDGIKEASIDNVIRYLKSTTQITTQKTTRGVIITICNYDLYQKAVNYRNDTENDAVNDIGTIQERHYKQELKKLKIKDIQTPAKIARTFFEMYYDKNIRNGTFKDYAKLFGTSEETCKGFCDYWTEKTKDGKRQKWELQKTFELNRRIATWMRNKENWGK